MTYRELCARLREAAEKVRDGEPKDDAKLFDYIQAQNELKRLRESSDALAAWAEEAAVILQKLAESCEDYECEQDCRGIQARRLLDRFDSEIGGGR